MLSIQWGPRALCGEGLLPTASGPCLLRLPAVCLASVSALRLFNWQLQFRVVTCVRRIRASLQCGHPAVARSTEREHRL